MGWWCEGGWAKEAAQITFSRLENVIFITLIKFKLSSRELSPAAYYTLPIGKGADGVRGCGVEFFQDKTSLIFLLIIIKNYQKQAIKSRPSSRLKTIFNFHYTMNERTNERLLNVHQTEFVAQQNVQMERSSREFDLIKQCTCDFNEAWNDCMTKISFAFWRAYVKDDADDWVGIGAGAGEEGWRLDELEAVVLNFNCLNCTWHMSTRCD